jgi:hypothetical protein
MALRLTKSSQQETIYNTPMPDLPDPMRPGWNHFLLDMRLWPCLVHNFFLENGTIVFSLLFGN